MRLKDRLRAFMAAHRIEGKKLTGTRFAAILQTPYATFEHWLRENDKQPPGCLLTLMDVLERSEEARRIAGIEE
jgi:DNA-binding transcriptional regulator YiaG